MFDSDFAHTLLERMGGNSATVVIDNNGVCVFANSNVNGVLNLAPEDLHQKSFSDVVTILTLDGDKVTVHGSDEADRYSFPIERMYVCHNHRMLLLRYFICFG